jgi:CRISPR/Cas system CSM-associated protein Csm3 (group 7 of RAMP superfamily)
MTPELSVFYVARVTLETVTPLSIGTGAIDGVFDVQLVRDANGLPAIPGSSLAGVLRHLYWLTHEDDPAVKQKIHGLFGYQEGDSGEASKLHISWGVMQDSKGKPVEGLLLGPQATNCLQGDKLLKVAIATADTPVFRDRVRISHRGAAEKMGKFDRSVLPAGYRFSVELSLWSHQVDDSRWGEILKLLGHPLFRIGAGTRAGLGKLKVVQANSGSFNLKDRQHRILFAKLDPSLARIEVLKPFLFQLITSPRFVTATLKLKPKGFWRIGQGDTAHCQDGSGKPADLLPKTEQRVKWNGGKAEIAVAELLIPASSIKGALAHRVAFHANRLNSYWAEEHQESIADYEKSEHCDAVKNLFGYARDDRPTKDGNEDKENQPKGQAGKIWIDDAFVEFNLGDLHLMMHNAIDRFSGGVREHFLFSEELVWKKPIIVNMLIDTDGLDNVVRIALKNTLVDLQEGRLSLGGGASKGHGLFEATLQFSDKAAWLNGKTSGAE